MRERILADRFLHNSIFHKLSSILWVLIVSLVVMLAIYVSVGRMVVSSLGVYQTSILSELNTRVPFTIEARHVSGEWKSFTPIIVLSGLRLSAPGNELPPLTLSEGRVAVDVLGSLLTGSLQMTRLALDGLELRGQLTEDGRLRIRGFDGEGEIGDWLRDFLLNIELISLSNNQLNLEFPGGGERNLDLFLRMHRDGSHRRLEVQLESDRGAQIDILAEGVGNPLVAEEFTGEVYTRVSTDDLGAVRQVLADRLPGIWASGAFDLELWLFLDSGKPELKGRLRANDLLISDTDGTQQLPLDHVNLEAQLVRSGDRWTLYAEDISIQQEAVWFEIPRLQLDTWEEAFRIRARELPLAPLSAMVRNDYGVSSRLLDILRQLAPEGTVDSLQLITGDIRNPATDWEVEARFSDVKVNPWRGVPGVASASGYLQLFPGSGQLLLDSRELSLDLPALYEHTLVYSDIHGGLDLVWDKANLSIASDLITAQGDEGTARALFSLDVPLKKTELGMQLDLLVGLENSHPVHRVKYVPRVLNPTLRDWLSKSIGDGFVEQGAFLWRGGLRKSQPELRSVQLAFNVRDTVVDYDPRWPGVKVKQGVLLIDDAQVSVWADDAELRESDIHKLSVETWLDGDRQLMLAVEAKMVGPAEDGLAVINSSPIDELVKGAFQEWSLKGDLETDLKLKLNLSDRKSPPEVEVATRWREVALDISPGSLPLRNVSGGLSYNSSLGFSSSALSGSLWGEDVAAQVEQQDGGDGLARSITSIRVKTRAGMDDLANWLNFKPLAFAQGETEAELQLTLARGEAPLLEVRSDLRGVSLDLPSPWDKAPDSRRAFELQTRLGVSETPVEMVLGEDLALVLDLRDGALHAGALGISEPPAGLEEGRFRVTGQALTLDGDEVTEFIRTYFQEPAPESGDIAASESGLSTNRPIPAIHVEDLQLGSLSVWGQNIEDLTANLEYESESSMLDVETDWLVARYQQSPDAPAELQIDRLDLMGLKMLDFEGRAEGELPLELPNMRVSIKQLYSGDSVLGELALNLQSEEGDLLASDITGRLAGLRLGEPDAGSLRWQRRNVATTELELGVSFDDLGAVLGQFDYEKIVETRSGRFDVDLEWPGAPQDFALVDSQGAVTVDIGPGRFLEAPSSASGALKVVNILNLADIVQRLSLSHMFETGIPFDSVEGELFMHSGTIEVVGMDIKGPSSFHFSGSSDVARRSLDGELVATIPVANNLPWVAALTAGLPVAAGVFVVSKLLEKQVDRLTSAVYSIEGSWNDPQVQFDHIFDSTAGQGEKALARAAAARQAGMESEPPAAGPQEADQESP